MLDSLIDLVQANHQNLIDKVTVLPIYTCNGSDKINFQGKTPSKTVFKKNVLLFDSVIHSGSTMTKAVDKLMGFGAKTVCSYTLVVKRGSSFIPTMWGVMIDDSDRVFLLLDVIPNQRLHAGSRKISSVHIQQLNEHHLENPKITSGVKSLDRVTWGDRFFDMSASEQSRCSYVLQAGKKALGYLTVHLAKSDCMVIDEIVVDKKHHNKGFGSILIRFAHTIARQSNCGSVRLFAHKKQLDFYDKNSYKATSHRPICVDGEDYVSMERTILHSTNCSFL
jgi:GNAT superfamily N-acetyltransferase